MKMLHSLIFYMICDLDLKFFIQSTQLSHQIKPDVSGENLILLINIHNLLKGQTWKFLS